MWRDQKYTDVHHSTRWHLTLTTITKINVNAWPMLLSLCSNIKCPFEQRSDHSRGCCYRRHKQHKNNIESNNGWVLMVAFDEMAQKERGIYEHWDSVCTAGATSWSSSLLTSLESSLITTNITRILVTGVRKRLCDTCRKFEFPLRAVCILFWHTRDALKLFRSWIFVYGVRQIPSWQVPLPQSLSSRHSRSVKSAEATTQASYGEFSSLKPSGHRQVGRWLMATHSAFVPHSVNPAQGSEHVPSLHSCPIGQSLLKWQPSSHSLVDSSGPLPQICPNGQFESDRQPGRQTFSSQYSPAKQWAS